MAAGTWELDEWDDQAPHGFVEAAMRSVEPLAELAARRLAAPRRKSRKRSGQLLRARWFESSGCCGDVRTLSGCQRVHGLRVEPSVVEEHLGATSERGPHRLRTGTPGERAPSKLTVAGAEEKAQSASSSRAFAAVPQCRKESCLCRRAGNR